MKAKQFYKNFLLLFLVLLASSTLANATTQYLLINLGTAQGFGESTAIGINSAGNTVGSSGDPYDGLSRGFFNQAGGAPSDIPFLPGYFYNWAVGINDNNQVAVDNRVTVDTGYDVSIYDIDTNTSTILGNGLANDINNSGTILGKSGGNITLFSIGGNTVVSGFSSYTFAQGDTLNNNGAFTGYVQGGSYGGTQAFLYSNNTVIEMGTLPNSGRSFGRGLNGLDQVVGSVEFYIVNTLHSKAFFWENGVMSDLGTLDGHDTANATDINNLGQIIGVSGKKSAGLYKPFIYENGTMTALEDLVVNGGGWDISGATAINDAGQITGTGYNNGQSLAILLTPVPNGDIAPHSAPDGSVNAGDLLLLTRMVLGSITYTGDELLRADLNSNATLDSGDIVLLLQLLYTP